MSHIVADFSSPIKVTSTALVADRLAKIANTGGRASNIDISDPRYSLAEWFTMYIPISRFTPILD